MKKLRLKKFKLPKTENNKSNKYFRKQINISNQNQKNNNNNTNLL